MGAFAALASRAQSLDGDAAEWLDAVVRAAATAIGRGVVGNLLERRGDGTIVSVHVALHGVAPAWRETLRRTAMRLRPEELERRFRTAVTQERGVLALSARADDRFAVLLDATLDLPLDQDDADGARLMEAWAASAEHLAAGLRLRAKIGGVRGRPPSKDDAEAVWHALLDGRLSIADRFDRAGRRFVVLRASETACDSGALTSRERHVLASVALGHANKRIALELGVSESTVSSALRGVAKKLGVRSRVELARIFAPSMRGARP